jgi:hypothetical protein
MGRVADAAVPARVKALEQHDLVRPHIREIVPPLPTRVGELIDLAGAVWIRLREEVGI